MTIPIALKRLQPAQNGSTIEMLTIIITFMTNMSYIIGHKRLRHVGPSLLHVQLSKRCSKLVQMKKNKLKHKSVLNITYLLHKALTLSCIIRLLQ